MIGAGRIAADPEPADDVSCSLIYWTMHITMRWPRCCFGMMRFDALAGSLLSISAAMLQMSLLGAVLTFARRPLFSVHALTTVPWACRRRTISSSAA